MPGLFQQWRPDEDHVCRLCNMVFSSHMVATSHYEGKVHAKNMRKQGLQSQGVCLWDGKSPVF